MVATPPDNKVERRRVEIVHESLLKNWPRLVRWQAQDADGAQLRDELRQAAQLWDQHGRADDYLWSGAAYREYQVWRDRYPGGLTELEQEFARAMASLALRRRRRQRMAVIVVITALLSGLAVVGSLWRRSVAETRRAEGSKLLALAQLELQEDPTEALALATASLELADTAEARLFALRTLQLAPPAWELVSEVRQMRVPAFSGDGRHLAVAGHSPVVGVWNDDGGPPVMLPDHEMSARGSNVAAWASDHLLVTGLIIAQQVHVWDMPAGTRLRTIDFDTPSFWQVGPGRLLAEVKLSSAQPLIELRSWRLPDGEAEILGRIDWSSLGGATYSVFAPDARAWLYTEGTTTHLVPLPLNFGAARVFSRHPANVRVSPLDGLQRLITQHDETGENRLISFPEGSPPVVKLLPRPLSAPPGVVCMSSDRWLKDPSLEDAMLRLWDTEALAGARPLELRREGSWYAAGSALGPGAGLVVATTHSISRLTFWPLPRRGISVVDGYTSARRPVAFSPDGQWLATSWADGRLRLWPLPGSSFPEVRMLNADAPRWISLAFDPGGRYLFAVGPGDNAWIVPLDGSPGRKLSAYSPETTLFAAAVSPSGSRVATAWGFGKGSKTLRVWDVDTGAVRLFDLPQPSPPRAGASQASTGAEGEVTSLVFLDETTLFSGGDGGIRRWNVHTGTHETLRSAPFGACRFAISLSTDRRELVFCEIGRERAACSGLCGVIDVVTGATRTLQDFTESPAIYPAGNPAGKIATRGPVVALGGGDGSVLVGPRSGGEMHLLLGHSGPVVAIDVSPDLRWIASTGEDNTLRLWPMPDLTQPPLHVLPHDELLAALRSLTNLRAVRDPASGSGWKVEVGPFPGWANLPRWQP